MPRFIHAADIHIGSLRGLRAGDPTWTEWKLARHTAGLRSLFELARKEQVPLVLAGDLFDRKDPALKERDLLLSALLDYRDVDCVMIAGNHDRVLNDYTSLDFVRLIKESNPDPLPKLHLALIEPKVVLACGIWWVLVPFCGLPSQLYRKRITRLLKEVPETATEPVVVVGHELALGCTNDAGTWTASSGLKLPKIPRVRYWAMGDIHKRQPLNSSKTAWYPGSHIQHRIDEAEDRGVLLIDTERANRPKFVPIKHPDVKPLIILSEHPGKGKWPDAWIDWRGGNLPVDAPDTVYAAGSTNEMVEQGEIPDVKVEHYTNPLDGLASWLHGNRGVTEEAAKAIEEYARTARE